MKTDCPVTFKMQRDNSLPTSQATRLHCTAEYQANRHKGDFNANISSRRKQNTRSESAIHHSAICIVPGESHVVRTLYQEVFQDSSSRLPLRCRFLTLCQHSLHGATSHTGRMNEKRSSTQRSSISFLCRLSS